MNQDPLADIATPDAVAAWLSDCGLDDLSETFQARGWYGDALLDADEDDLEAVVGSGRMRLLRRLLEPLRQLRFASKTALTRKELDQPVEACRALGRDWAAQPWLATVLETWPGPIAHEIYMLGELLKQGKAVGALMQMRDVAEVLIKIPAVIMARDLLEHGASAKVQAKIRKVFFTTDLSMGTWLGLARDLARAVVSARGDERTLFAPEVAGLFVVSKGALTVLYDTLDAQTSRRNWDLGHGAFRIDEAEIVATLRHYLLGDLPAEHWGRLGLTSVVALAKGLSFALTVRCWDRLALKIEGPGVDRPLIGWHSIRDYHDGEPSSGHEERSAAVLVMGAERAEPLRLAPYLAARICVMCDHRDVFVFNGWDRKQRYDLLDYMMGHRMRRSWQQVKDLHQESRRQPPPSDMAPAPAASGLSLTRGSVIALLDAAAFDKRYLSPAYLREPLRKFLTDAERGLFWLQAPAHVGKSMFVLGLAEAAAALRDEQPLLEGLKIAAVFIRKEYRYGPAQLSPLLESGLKKTLDVAERADRRLPQINLDATDKPGAFVRCVDEFRVLANFHGKLLICLDGLDELHPPEQGLSMLDFLPAPERLPVNTYVLLTSRPRADRSCPGWVWQRLAGRLARQTDFRAHAVNLSDSGYRTLLRDYFDRELGEARATLEHQLLAAGGESATARRDATARFDRLFETLVEKAEGLFLYVAFLIDRVKEGDVPLDENEITALPERQDLFTAYLDGLADTLAPKHAELAWAVLLNLAAVEQAHAWYIEGRQPPYAVQPEWRGVPLDTLVDLLHQQGAEGELIYILFRLKAVLGSWRGEAAPATRYHLGLKGLSNAIAGHKTLGPALLATHQRLAREALALMAPPPEAGELSSDSEAPEPPSKPPLDPISLRYVLAHAELSRDGLLADEIAGSDTLISSLIGMFKDAHHRTRLEAAIRWSTLVILVQERRLRAGGSDQDWNSLALAYASRGSARVDGNDLTGALADHDQAIELMEGLRARLGEDWPPAWINNLAAAYVNRGNGRGAGNDSTGALVDYGQAIKLMGALRARLGEDWSPAWANELAMAYMNRGNARSAGNDLTGALADHDQAIELMEGLRARLGADWPPAWANNLAAAYMNRGSACSEANDLAGALADYGRTIELMEALRVRLGEDWLPAWANDLAMAYMNRGVACDNGNDLAGALADHDQAIELLEALRTQLGEDWPLAWTNDLAKVHKNRGNTRGAGNDLTGALADYGQAIELMEGLRARLGEDWPTAWTNDLATVYMNRGITRGGGDDPTGALADHGQAIELMEALRARLGDRWPPAWANDLAKAYTNRGGARDEGDDLTGALADYNQAIALRDDYVIARNYLAAIPDQATTFCNLVLLSDQDDLAKPSRSSARAEARHFIEKLNQLVDISQLPEQWQEELTYLDQLLR